MEKRIEKVDKFKIKFSKKIRENHIKNVRVGHVEVGFEGKSVFKMLLAPKTTKNDIRIIENKGSVVLILKNNEHESPQVMPEDGMTRNTFEFVAFDKRTGDILNETTYYQSKMAVKSMKKVLSGYKQSNLSNQAEAVL